MYNDMVRIEQTEKVVISYPCVYDPRQRRITELDASGRHQYVEVPVIQLVFFALALARTVWRMLLYRRMHKPRPARAGLHMRLWSEFADAIW